MSQGFYERRVFPRINDAVGRSSVLRALRRDLLAAVSGAVVEIGFGTGANVPFYSSAVTSLVGIEPSVGMTDAARKGRHRYIREGTSLTGLTNAAGGIHIVRAVAESLPVGAGMFDSAVSTLTLCSVSQPDLVLAELWRVLKPSGTLFVLEHGRAPDENIVRWQRRLNGLQQRVACGCHLDRPMSALIAGAGFSTTGLHAFYVRGVPRILGALTLGVARKEVHEVPTVERTPAASKPG